MKLSESIVKSVNTMQIDRKHYKLIEQIESSSTSVFLNIAEGYGRGSSKDFLRFLYISRGSLNETVSLIIFFKEMNWLKDDQCEGFISESEEIAKMLNSFIKKIQSRL